MDRLGGAFGAHDAQDHLDDDFVDEADAGLDPPPSPVGQDERRMQVRAYNHWASLLGDAAFPNIEDLEPELLDDFGPYSVLLDFSTGIENPAVRFVGGELRKECDVEGPLEHLDDVPPRSLLSRITDHYMQILANQAPIGFEAEFVNQRGLTVLYRGILLPYSSDDETIDFIFGVINWKELADAKTADELLLQIDQALAGETVEIEAVEEVDDMLELTQPLEDLSAEASDDWDNGEDEDDTVLDLGSDAVIEDDEEAEIPAPAFGQVENGVAASVTARRERGVDALGNPLGSLAAESHDEDGAGEDDFDTGIKTAADYGLPDWDEEDYEDDDVDDLVDPLLRQSRRSRRLTSRESRSKTIRITAPTKRTRNTKASRTPKRFRNSLPQTMKRRTNQPPNRSSRKNSHRSSPRRSRMRKSSLLPKNRRPRVSTTASPQRANLHRPHRTPKTAAARRSTPQSAWPTTSASKRRTRPRTSRKSSPTTA